MKIGIHTGPQDIEMDTLLALWRRADEAGFHWISVWTTSMRIHSSLVPILASKVSPRCPRWRQRRRRHVWDASCSARCSGTPRCWPKAAVTVDHVSGGRAELGLGAGWLEEEFDDFGYDFPPLGKRLDQLEEALAVTRSLLHDEETHFEGEYYKYSGAVCSPKPVNGTLRLWVGGRGKKRTPRLAAKFADGFNMPYLPPDDAADRLVALRQACDVAKRDAAEIETSVNVAFYLDGERGAESPPEHLAPGALTGSMQQAIDRIGEYADAGLDGLNLAFRPPIDPDLFERFIEDVLPVFHGT